MMYDNWYFFIIFLIRLILCLLIIEIILICLFLEIIELLLLIKVLFVNLGMIGSKFLMGCVEVNIILWLVWCSLKSCCLIDELMEYLLK